MTAPVGADRLSEVVALLTQLACGALSTRGVPSDADDEVDAVIVGVNMLAEELEASHNELEARVRERTADLQQLNDDVMRLTELGNLLQACGDASEAYEVVQQVVTLMFPGLAGALYLFNPSRDVLERKLTWGNLPAEQMFPREHCWALRRGQRHQVRGETGLLSCQHILERLGNSLCVPMAAHGDTLGMLHLMDRSLQPGLHRQLLTEAKQQLAVAVAEQTALSLANLDLRATLRHQALRDPLTGLFNRRFVDEWIEPEIARARHAGTSLGIMMADIDHFKQFNDVHGHDAGDSVLVAVATAIRDSVRAGDVPCRYGGEEFLILMADVDRDNLIARAEQLRKSVARATVAKMGANLPRVTISVGLALYPAHGATPGEVIKKADSALYIAKRQGRNCVVTAAADEPRSPTSLAVVRE